MKSKPIQIIVLEADEGMVLTNGEVYSTQVYLGTADDPANWWEVPESEVPAEDPDPEEVADVGD